MFTFVALNFADIRKPVPESLTHNDGFSRVGYRCTMSAN